MQMIVDRDRLRIYTQSEQDRAYIEDTLGLKNPGDCILLTRTGPTIAPTLSDYLITKPLEEGDYGRHNDV